MNDSAEEPTGEKGSGRRNMILVAILAIVGLATAFGFRAYIYREQASQAAANAPPYVEWMFIDAGNFELVSKGRKVYEANCAECHGFGLKGEPNWQRRGPDGILPAPPHDETGHTWHHPDAILFATVKQGGEAFMPAGIKSGMPGYKDVLTDREIEASIAYIKSRWPDEVRRKQEMRNMQSSPVKR
jgi:mono/diheme cytochrome c family protein